MEKKLMLEYWNPYVFSNAGYVVGILCACLVIAGIVIRIVMPHRDAARTMWRLILVFWVFTIVSATLFGREEQGEAGLNMDLFWCIRYAWAQRSWLHWYYIIGNILLFLPLGVILPAAYPRMQRWWSTMMVGLLLTVLVEVTQYVTKTGLCELDDVVHNTWGTLLGYHVWVLFLYRRNSKSTLKCDSPRQRTWRLILSGALVVGTVVVFGVLLAVNRPEW